MCHAEIGYHAANRWRAAIAARINDADALSEYAGYLHSDATSPGNACGECRGVAPKLMEIARLRSTALTQVKLQNAFGDASLRCYPDGWKPVEWPEGFQEMV